VTKKPPNAGKGRPKGSKNKNTAAVKDMVLAALSNVGGEKYLERQAEENPTAFLTLVGKVIPTQVNHGGHDGEKLEGFKVILVGKAS
jgi:hypothetical protein